MRPKTKTKADWRLVAVALTAGMCSAWAEGATSPVTGYAWSETVGWVNFSPQHGGVTFHEVGDSGYLSGHAWGENVGWIKMGSGTGPYANQSSEDWGVNMQVTGSMDGYAWSETMGWINFGDVNGPPVILNTATGQFSSHAWGENLGWVNFRSASYGVLRGGAGGDPDAVPTLSEWGAIVLLLALALASRQRLAQIGAHLRNMPT